MKYKVNTKYGIEDILLYLSNFSFWLTVRRIMFLYQLLRMETPMHNTKCLPAKMKHLEMSLWLLEGHDCIQYSLSFNFQIAALLIMSYHVINCVDSVPHVFSTNNSFSVE